MFGNPISKGITASIPWYSKFGNDVFPHEFLRVAFSNIGQGLHLDPLGKGINYNDQEPVVSYRPQHGPDDVNPPFVKWPRTCYRV